MGQIVSCVAMSVTWCFCTAMGSLFTSCFGNDKASNIPPSASSGRRRSVLLLVMTVLLCFLFQYVLAPEILDIQTRIDSNRIVQYVAPETALNFIEKTWRSGCNDVGDDPDLILRCVANAGVYRVCACTTIFFILAAIAVRLKRTANREAWPAKYVLYLFLCGISVIIPNEPLFVPHYRNIAIIGAIIFICIEQIILLDMAYNWNESWVEKSNKADAEEGYEGAGKKWLIAILMSCCILFLGSIIAIGFMFHYFQGCDTNIIFISITLVLIALVTIIQLTGEEGSLLASAVIASWATYLCYSAVSKNPNGQCNPKLGNDDIDGVVLGLGITLISLGWTGFSYTAESTMGGSRSSDASEVAPAASVSKKRNGNGNRDVKGVVTNYGTGDDESPESPTTMQTRSSSHDDDEEDIQHDPFSNGWKLNLILASVSCFVAVSLTGWGSIQHGGDAANPQVSKVSMWVIIASQWLVMVLYIWTLMAPRIFPDRDFS